jgi:hypothetical protein
MKNSPTECDGVMVPVLYVNVKAKNLQYAFSEGCSKLDKKTFLMAIMMMVAKNNSFSRVARETDCYAWPSQGWHTASKMRPL